ncbi:MAG: hypothetical protein AAF705_06785 [Bacteroidota bacterium]
MKGLFLFFSLLTLSLYGQQYGQNAMHVGEDCRQYQATVFPQDTSQLWIGDGDINRDTVLIVGEGGPKRHLDFESNGRVYWEYLPNQDHYYIAVVHQSSTYNSTIFGATDFTLEDAFKEVDNTSEILFRAIKYFKNRGKYVVVLGHSYSAFVIPHYLSTRPSLADKYLITGGRLDANLEQTALQLKGLNSGFEEDGKTLIKPKAKPNPYRRARYKTIRKNKELLKYALGKTRYTEALKDIDLSNLIFYYGTKDQNVGVLSSKERTFLKAKNATLVGVETDHYNIWKRVIDAFDEGRLRL